MHVDVVAFAESLSRCDGADVTRANGRDLAVLFDVISVLAARVGTNACDSVLFVFAKRLSTTASKYSQP